MHLKSWLMNNLESELANWTKASSDEIQNLIQKTFLWLAWITAIVFASWYYILGLLNSWVISSGQYSIAFWSSAILGLILIIAITWWYQKMNYATLAILAILFAILEWIWIAWILAIYNSNSIINAFAWASLLFVLMSIYWYFTKTDLTKIWTILIVWLISIIILTLINIFFIHSTWFDLVLSIVWLLIFLCLTAWDLQILKQMAQTWDKRLEIVFWISLYLDFINIFLELLSLFGNSRD